MLNPSGHLLLIALFGVLIMQCAAYVPAARTLASQPSNQYKDYRLYSVKMPENYELVRPADEGWSSDSAFSESVASESVVSESVINKSTTNKSTPNESSTNESRPNGSTPNESATDESTSSGPAAREQSSNQLFYSLMSQLIQHVPIDIWQMQLNYSLFTVSPDYYVQVEDYLLNNSLSFDVLDSNIQERLNSEWLDVSQADDSIFNANLLLNSSFKLDTYHPIDEVRNRNLFSLTII